VPDASTVIKQIAAVNPAAAVKLVSTAILSGPGDSGAGGNSTVNRTATELTRLGRGLSVYGQICAECHGPSGQGTPTGTGQMMAPALSGNPRVTQHPEYVIKALLHGLTGPIADRSYAAGVMVPFGATESDEWVASAASYIRTNLTNNAFTVTPEMVKAVRDANAVRKTPWTYAELAASVPTLMPQQTTWKVTASHSAPSRIGMTGDPAGAFDFEGWTTGVGQQAGMWWQLELPSAQNVAEIHFYSPNAAGGGGGGGRGRGAAPGAAPAPPPPPPQTQAPRGYKVEVSTDGATWTQVAEGTSAGNMTDISWTPRPARFVKITQTATTPGAPAWSMLETKVYSR
jgi:mono/diheme cytochrome c family protein